LRAASSAAVEQECLVTLLPSLRRTTLTGAILLALALGSAACGGGDADTTDDPSETPTSSTPTVTPTPTEEPLSAFEDRPQVKALRSWAAAATRDLNARRHTFPTARQFEVDTAKVRSDVAKSWQEDFDKYYPGPLPLTPIAVAGSGRRSVITTCVIASGFALTKKGGKPAEKRHVIATEFTMAKQSGTWLLAGILAGTADCDGVKIKGVEW
jgi:hypothetical protein